MPLGLERYMLDAEPIVDYMMQHPDKLYCLLAETVRDHHMVAWGRMRMRTRVLSHQERQTIVAQSAEIGPVSNVKKRGDLRTTHVEWPRELLASNERVLFRLLWRPPFQRIQIQKPLTEVDKCCSVIRLCQSVRLVGK